jgi:hypothetical protein
MTMFNWVTLATLVVVLVLLGLSVVDLTVFR